MGLDYIEEWVTVPYRPFGVVIGIDDGVLPPDDRLNDGQVERLIDGILDLWASRSMCAELPEGLPLRLAYRALTGRWNGEPIQYLARGTVTHLSFCDCDPATCAFGEEFCDCAKFTDEELEMPPPREGDELPF